VSNRGRPSKKNHIILSAGQLFCELGYQGTSIDLVVQKAEVSKPTVYNNFPSKLLLYKAWQDNELSRLKASLKEAASNESWIGREVNEIWVTGLWQQIYYSLFSDASFLAITRIILGEPYKLDADASQSYRDFLYDLQTQTVELVNIQHENAHVIAESVFLNVFSARFLKLKNSTE